MASEPGLPFADARAEEQRDDVLSESARPHLIWSLTEGVGPILYTRILEHFGSASEALDAPARALEQIRGVGRSSSDRIVATRGADAAGREIERARSLGVRILCREDADYPEGLRRIPDAPIVLYVRGDVTRADTLALAVVGSRRCSIYGSEQARRFGELLAGAGFTVVSGLARGVDAFAHHGAVDAGGRSIAVLGSGLREAYPPENRPLAERLLTSGAWISELPLDVPVRAENFPSRNRIIAGMTLGTLVVEAAQRSGALITARLAGEYNREVFALPGRLDEPMACGTNALIRDGAAKLVTGLDDILAELGDVGRLMAPDEPERPPPAAASVTNEGLLAAARLTDVEERVYAAIEATPTPQDRVLATADVGAGETLAALTSLELKGLIRRLPGHLVARRDAGRSR